MKCSIDTKTLSAALDLLMRVAERKNTIPVLATIRFDADSDKLSLTATDLDNYLTIPIDATITEHGSACLSARRLREIVDTITEGSIDLDCDSPSAALSQGALSYKLWTASADAFPEIPAFESTPIGADSATLQALISHIAFSITQEEGRYTLSGAKVLIDKTGATFITTDGHRLSLATLKTITSKKAVDVLIPLRALNLISDLSRLVETVTLGFDEDRMYVQAGTVQLNARLLSGTFPDWKRVIPETFARTVTVDSEELAKAITQVMITADSHSHFIHIALSDGVAEIAAQDSDECSAKTSIPIAADGEPITLAFNGNYLREVVSIRKGAVEIAINDASSQVRVRLLSDSILDDYQHVLMPCR